MGILFSGIITWIIGRNSFHIGASGLIYVLMSFILFKGIFSKNFNLMALSLVVVFIYGSLVWYIFPLKQNMSWEGHLSGFLIGFLFALYFKQNVPKKYSYDWEKENFDDKNDPFISQFDSEGNFIESNQQDDL